VVVPYRGNGTPGVCPRRGDREVEDHGVGGNEVRCALETLKGGPKGLEIISKAEDVPSDAQSPPRRK